MKDLKKIFKDLESVTKADEKPRVLLVKISTPEVDRSKDVVQPKGMNAKNFLKNPIVLFAHKYDELPIAKCIDLKTSDNGIMATVQFPEEGVYEKADIVYQMYKEGFLNAWSIGFRADDYEENSEGGYNFKSWELFEFSSVPVPDNPGALTVMRSKGINVDALLEEKEVEAPKTPEYTDETKLTELTVGQLKSLMNPEPKQVIEEDKDVHDTRLKDVQQVTSIGYLLSDLTYMLSWFQETGVSQSTLDKLKQAQTLLTEAIKEQAVIGQKTFDIDKMGRAISSKHEGMLKEAADHMKSAAEKVQGVLDTVAEQDDSEVPIVHSTNTFLQKLNNSLKTNNQKQDLTLRLLKEIKSGKGGEK